MSQSTEANASQAASPERTTTRTSNDASNTSSPAPLEEHIRRLTTVVQDVSDHIDTCHKASEERHEAAQAREEEQRRRQASAYEQLLKIAAMTREMVNREKETTNTVTSSPQSYAQDLQRAAFGAGGTPDSISRSSMMDRE